VFKKSQFVVVLAASLFAVSGAPSGATVLGFPKALNWAIESVEANKPAGEELSADFPCAGNFDECRGQPQKASLLNFPKALKPQLERLPLDSMALPPMAHSVFCYQYPQDCVVRKMAFRGRKYELTAQRWQDLVEINTKVNRSIRPERNTLGYAGEKWIVAPASGDCNDYAVTKQHELLARGWPSRTLLLAEVVTHWGEHHLILVVRTASGDFILDSMHQRIRPWAEAPYRWVRVQSPRNPRAWSTIRTIST